MNERFLGGRGHTMNIFTDHEGFFDSADAFFANSKHIPFIAISIGTKAPELVKVLDILRWVLKCSYNIIPILFVDSISTINYRAFGDSEARALKEVEKSKSKHEIVWREALLQLTHIEKLRLRFVGWDEIVTPRFIAQQDIIREDFLKKESLYDIIMPVAEFIITSSGKTNTPERCLKLSEYIVQELPMLLFGIHLDNINYRMMIYPTYTATSEMEGLLAAIRGGGRFSTLLDNLRGQNLEYNKLIHMIIGA